VTGTSTDDGDEESELAMNWNYRVMEFESGDDVYHEIREVYYDSEGNPNGYTARTAGVGSDSANGLSWVLDRMREALDKPVLKPSDCQSTLVTNDPAAVLDGREDWQEYRTHLATIAEAFGTSVRCHSKNGRLAVDFRRGTLDQVQIAAVAMVEDLVELLSEFPPGYLVKLDPPNTSHAKPVVRILSVGRDDEARRAVNSHDVLDGMKHKISCEVLSRFSVQEIKERALENLMRWKSQGTWSMSYDEWTDILQSPDERLLISSMVGTDQKSNRLRQSMPYVGMLDQGNCSVRVVAS
jgi:hypothetical protein